MNNELPLPYSAEAERAVLGSILINPAQFQSLDLTPSDFYVQVNGVIYATMIELDLNDIDIDVISLTNALSMSRQLEIVGGMNYIIELTNDVPSSMNAETYAHIVKDKANRRNIILKARELTMAAYDSEKDITSAVANTIDSIVANVNIGEGAKPVSHVISELIDQVDDAIANPRDVFGIATGFPGFDKITRGLQKKEVAILAGEPGIGKSSFAVQLGIGMAKGSNGVRGKPGAIYELEMSSIATIRRVIAYES
jgi:replicative DNA helicase